jgi:low affinity Fe/Cu permease
MDTTHVFATFANAVSRLAGRAWTFVICIVLVLAWAVTGPLFGYSATWQLAINTSTTIITFRMVFLIQNTQNRDNAALQAKLDELIRVTNAKNGYIGIERLTDKELEEILQDFETQAEGTPLGRKSRLVERKANEVRRRRAAGKPA